MFVPCKSIEPAWIDVPVVAPSLIVFVEGTEVPIFIFPISLPKKSKSTDGVGVSISVAKIFENVTVP